ncbi:hypothetical protein CANARDRAFT_27545 [[Candida] arabinofermentans NRRL YB-2248]|uniref:EamA domain-containing protein n=1 Tax=[Candida] arabinofermentans NRRL YB-2248 TaxID=983967 RepID=A0A1E4T3H8_9ASCO|nr:hypothetical protein CANARDRAFT_27545 [[Candida] arabinofermentans NRRL YB-2248]
MTLSEIVELPQSARLTSIHRSRREWRLGLFFLSCVVVLWVLSSVLLNSLFESGTYSKPFLITWINTATFSLYLIPYYYNKYKGKLSHKSKVQSNDIYGSTAPNHQSDNPTTVQSYEEQVTLQPLTFTETKTLALWFCGLWFLSNLTTNSSLIYTSVSSQTILSSTSSFFTIVIGYFFSIESINGVKLGCLVMSFVGVLLVTNNDDPSASGTKDYIFVGNLLALSGALCYGVYSILLKWKVRDDSRMDMKLFFGYVGVFNTLFLWPPLVVLHLIGFETFEIPKTPDVYFLIGFNCFISFLADFLWARAMLLTSPLTVTLGLSLTIPLAMIFDLVLKHELNSWVYVFGAVLICISFYIVNKDEQKDEDE